MSEKKMSQKKSNKRNNKCKIKCRTCQFYDCEGDYCTERDIDCCTKQTNINFSKCDDYIIKETLVMF